MLLILELLGCLTQGDDVRDALNMIEDAKTSRIDNALQNGIAIPEPADDGTEKIVISKYNAIALCKYD